MKILHTKELTCFSIVYENLKIQDRPRAVIFHDGSMLYEEQSCLLKRYTFFDYYNDHYTNTFIHNEDTPHLICTACGSFSHLDNLMYDQNVIEHLNTVGLNIYLYETIFLDTGKKRKSLNIVEADDVYCEIKNSLVGFESTRNNLESMYCFDFEKIQDFVTRNKLKNVTVYSGDYKVAEYFGHIYPNFNLLTQDIFLTSLFKPVLDKFNSYEYAPIAKIDNNILYKFWCGTRRYEGYRQLTVAYLINKQSLCSYQHKVEDSPFRAFDTDPNRTTPLWGELDNYLWFNFNKWEDQYSTIYNTILTGLDTIAEASSKSIDRDIEDVISLETYLVPIEHYTQCFCAVVTEARYAQPTGNFSEKTLNAIKCLRPFILVAPPYTLEYLKSYGIKTFSDYWDESYDLEENHEQRLLKVFKVIDYIDSFTVSQLTELYNKMLPILTYNHDVIKNIAEKKYHG
jgi:hypothetical protein